MELTNTERKILGLMLKNFNNIIKFTDMGYIEIDEETFSLNDLFNLAEKLGVSDFL